MSAECNRCCTPGCPNSINLRACCAALTTPLVAGRQEWSKAARSARSARRSSIKAALVQLGTLGSSQLSGVLRTSFPAVPLAGMEQWSAMREGACDCARGSLKAGLFQGPVLLRIKIGSRVCDWTRACCAVHPHGAGGRPGAVERGGRGRLGLRMGQPQGAAVADDRRAGHQPERAAHRAPGAPPLACCRIAGSMLDIRSHTPVLKRISLGVQQEVTLHSLQGLAAAVVHTFKSVCNLSRPRAAQMNIHAAALDNKVLAALASAEGQHAIPQDTFVQLPGQIKGARLIWVTWRAGDASLATPFAGTPQTQARPYALYSCASMRGFA